MKKRTRRTYKNPFRVYNMNGKNYVYDSVTGESLFNAPEEQGFKGLSKFFEKHFKSLKSWREVVLFLEKHGRKNNDRQFTYPKYLEVIAEDLTTKYDNKVVAFFEDLFENRYEVIKPRVFRLKLKRV